MYISAHITNKKGEHTVALKTDGREQSLAIAPRPDGYGSSVNGGELLFLALATCYCNDLYREARKRTIEIARVQVEVSGEFGGEGEPARGIVYHATVDSKAPPHEVIELMRHTDTVAEIQNTLRRSTPVLFVHADAHEESE